VAQALTGRSTWPHTAINLSSKPAGLAAWLIGTKDDLNGELVTSNGKSSGAVDAVTADVGQEDVRHLIPVLARLLELFSRQTR
jgi:hypothetical protein